MRKVLVGGKKEKDELIEQVLEGIEIEPVAAEEMMDEKIETAE